MRTGYTMAIDFSMRAAAGGRPRESCAAAGGAVLMGHAAPQEGRGASTWDETTTPRERRPQQDLQRLLVSARRLQRPCILLYLIWLYKHETRRSKSTSATVLLTSSTRPSRDATPPYGAEKAARSRLTQRRRRRSRCWCAEKVDHRAPTPPIERVPASYSFNCR